MRARMSVISKKNQDDTQFGVRFLTGQREWRVSFDTLSYAEKPIG